MLRRVTRGGGRLPDGGTTEVVGSVGDAVG